jgi:hypothetical protein
MQNLARYTDLGKPFPQIERGKAFEPCRKLRRGELLRLLQVARARLIVTIGHGALIGKFIEHGAGISRDTDSHRRKRAGINAAVVLAGAHARRAGDQYHCGNLFG